jgi:hypothetical protein
VRKAGEHTSVGRKVEDKMAGSPLAFGHERSPDRAGDTASDSNIADVATISLTAQSDTLRDRIGVATIHVARLPFLIGRVPFEGEAQSLSSSRANIS